MADSKCFSAHRYAESKQVAGHKCSLRLRCLAEPYTYERAARMKQGEFCFIADLFYSIHDKECLLMQNKETIDGVAHGRPCFYAFPDKQNPSIYWCVPISSKLDKYERIYNHKLVKQREKGVKTPKCDTLFFADVMGTRKVFLIQNMFPVTEKYITEIYINKLTQEAVRIPQNAEAGIIARANDVLKLVRRGNRHLVFSDIIKTYDALGAELAADTTR